MERGECKNIWVYLEHSEGKLRNVALELIGQARQLADASKVQVGAVLIGKDVAPLAQEAIESGADFVYLVEGDEYAHYSTDGYTAAFCQAVNEYKPAAILVGATPDGRDLAPRIAGRLETGLCADCTELAMDPETNLVAWTRPAMGGNIMATIFCPNHAPQMGTVRPNVFKKPEKDPSRKGEVIKMTSPITQNEIRTRFLELIPVGSSSVNLEEAEIIVSGGRGMHSEAGFKLIEELADLLGATVGASRAVVDAGWKPAQHQIGQTGKTVAPKIYFAFGISGAIQHLAGMSSSDVIIAVNKDADAPIFRVADYGVVADAMEFLPAFIRTIKAQRA